MTSGVRACVCGGGEGEACPKIATFSLPSPPLAPSLSPGLRNPHLAAPRTRRCAPAASTAWRAPTHSRSPGLPERQVFTRGHGYTGSEVHGVEGLLPHRAAGSRPSRHMLPPGPRGSPRGRRPRFPQPLLLPRPPRGYSSPVQEGSGDARGWELRRFRQRQGRQQHWRRQTMEE